MGPAFVWVLSFKTGHFRLLLQNKLLNDIIKESESR